MGKAERIWRSYIGVWMAFFMVSAAFLAWFDSALGAAVAAGGGLAVLNACLSYRALSRFLLRNDPVSLRAVLWSMAARFLGIVLGIGLGVRLGGLPPWPLIGAFLLAYLGLKIGEVHLLGRSGEPRSDTRNG
jgi:hypothetical protein